MIRGDYSPVNYGPSSANGVGSPTGDAGSKKVGGGEGGVSVHKELISNNVQRKQHNQQQSSSASLSFSSNVEPSSNTTDKVGTPKGDSVNKQKEARKSNSSTNNNSNSSTYIYKDYANEEDVTTKIMEEYAGLGCGIINHEDETTKNLMQQKLPAKLAAMLSDPGEF